ncbi:MAG: hypothetical protein ACR2QE_13540 [Acidimicrobiales bacterium]
MEPDVSIQRGRPWGLGRRPLAAIVFVLAMVCAACTSSGEEAGTTDAATTTAAAPISAEPTSTTASSTTTTTAALTASFRGVTEDTIELGVAIVDFQELNDLGFIDFTHGDKEAIWEALFADLNERGGINGRKVEAVYEVYLPVGNEPAEAACIRFTEDEAVFAVLGLWVGETVLCLTDQHETIYVGHQPSQANMDRSRAVLASPGINPERRLDALLSVLDQTGELTDSTVGILAQLTNEDAVRRDVVPRLEEVAAGVGSVGVISAEDQVGTAAEIATFVERWTTEGVDTVFFLGATAQNEIPAVVDALGPDIGKVSDIPEVARQLADSSGRADAYDGLLTMNGLNTTDSEQFDEPMMQACISLVVDALPGLDEVVPSADVVDGEPDWYTGIRDACTNLTVFEAATAAAGPVLTNESFRIGLEGLGSIPIAGQVFSSFSPGKWDGEDGFRLYVYDAEAGDGGAFVARSEIVDVTAG